MTFPVVISSSLGYHFLRVIDNCSDQLSSARTALQATFDSFQSASDIFAGAAARRLGHEQEAGERG